MTTKEAQSEAPSVDALDKIFEEFQAQVIDGCAGPVNGWATLKEEAKAGVYSLLISKLPDTPENKAVLAEMFRSGDE